jgi:hypothetical protein
MSTADLVLVLQHNYLRTVLQRLNTTADSQAL